MKALFWNRRYLSCAKVSRAFLAAPLFLFCPTATQAALTISTSATQNMNCNAGVCAPTATNANLNINDLENDLASANLMVTTTGSGVEAVDIQIDAGIEWTSSNSLSLTAYHSIAVDQPVAVNGTGGLSITTNNGGNGGTFSFVANADVSFLDLSSALMVNGTTYKLEDSVSSLARAIKANPSGNYALANNYDSSKDGSYKNAAITTEFSGAFEGLGNTISNLSLTGTGAHYVGLFAEVGSGGQLGGSVENIVLQNASAKGKGNNVGALVGVNAGTITSVFVNGTVSTDYYHNGIGPAVGLLAGRNYGTILLSAATGNVAGTAQNGDAGGLVGANIGPIMLSYANCSVSTGQTSAAGGLIGGNLGPVSQSYALGSAKGGNLSDVGGLVGENSSQSTITQSYSTAAVKLDNDTGGYKGGLIGIDNSPPGSNAADYWDTSTSEIQKLSKGAGNVKNDPGITGLTSAQLQSGLPAGFDPTVWAENPNINNGFPYLIANPPR